MTNTNLYATARQATAWVPTTLEEIWRYIAVLIRQGIVHLPELHQYWEVEYRDSYISLLMSRDRFLQLHRYFHIVPPGPSRSTPDHCPEDSALLSPVPAPLPGLLRAGP